MTDKASDALKTISEVSKLLQIPPHVLRFWESKFSGLKPLKRSGGRRYYRPDDVVFLRHIQKLLHVDGFTIKGAQKALRGKKPPEASFVSSESNEKSLSSLFSLLNDLRSRTGRLKHKLEAQNPLI